MMFGNSSKESNTEFQSVTKAGTKWMDGKEKHRSLNNMKYV